MNIPATTFPLREDIGSVEVPSNESSDVQSIDREIIGLLINSDANECNENFSIFLKFIVDNVYMDRETGNGSSYHMISKYAMKLLTSNLFVKNYDFCVGKILAFLSAFNQIGENESCDKVRYESECFKEFLCIVLLLMLKMANTEGLEVSSGDLFLSLREYEFVYTMSNFIANHVEAANKGSSSFVLLKFSCDIFFEYLYHMELLSDEEFACMTQKSEIVPTLIEHLLNDNFNNYDINGDDFEDEDKLIAYEGFKLLLLINEQYLMKTYTTQIGNRVFEGLMCPEQSNRLKISGFINLLIYHLNREESQIIKILILKFLYLVFTTSSTTKLIYLNDLKILVDIFIRELNNLDYTDHSHILLLTYLKVTHPLLLFSELNELQYKKREIVDILSRIVVHASTNPSEEAESIVKLASKCMSIEWLSERTTDKRVQKQKIPDPPKDTYSSSSIPSPTSHENASASSLTESQPNPKQFGYIYEENASSDSLGSSFTRRASVRSFSRGDFYRHTTLQNKRQSMQQINEAFKGLSSQDEKPEMTSKIVDSQYAAPRIQTPVSEQNMLDLPTDYLNSKPLPMLPSRPVEIPRHTNSSTSSTNSISSLVIKALKKKAPPPPTRPYDSPPSKSEPRYERPSLRAEGRYDSPPPPPPPRRRR